MKCEGLAFGQTNIFDIVGVNDRIQLEVRGKLYASRVEDFSEDEIYAAAPIDGGNYLIINTGQSLAVHVTTDGEMQKFSCNLKTTTDDGIFCVVLTNFQDMGKVQRRDYNRVTVSLPVRHRVDSAWDKNQPWRTAIVQDISGGGIHATGGSLAFYQEGALVELELCLPSRKPVYVIGKVIRSWVAQSSSGAVHHRALEFVQIHPGERRRIIQFVQKKEIEIGRADLTTG